MTASPYINHRAPCSISSPSKLSMPDRKMSREDARPTLPPVRDLFRDELSRSPRPPPNPSHPWIVPGPRTDQNFDRSFSRAERRQESRSDGPAAQRPTPSTAYYSYSTQQRRDERPPSRTLPPDNLSSRYNSQAYPQFHARSTSQPDQRAAPHDQCAPPGSRPYSYLPTESYNYSHSTAGISSRGSGSYAEAFSKDQYREPTTTPVASDYARRSSISSPSSLKYECDYCGKGFTRPSSLKIHLNSHTGEKPFVCTFEGCGRCFSVLSNMRRHARVHSDVPSRHQENSGDEQSDRQ